MFQVRKDEPGYAFVPQVEVPVKNQWGHSIATVASTVNSTVNGSQSLTGKSLNINGDAGIGVNPNRYKQHGFHFTADNCIGCHACEAACSEKNDLPAHLSFRSVGYVEGGSYPSYRRLNISMACNHCDNPVCLKGCPTRAYTKFAEYGAVLQDPEICFGCGYCTWVCPYNAPQLDPIKGQVSKCNMCVDRLEVGLKPACAAACLGGALDFGIIESTPEHREQIKLQIPGFPDPKITHPNIRFQQTRTLPRELTRPDSMPVRYQRDEQGQGEYKTKPALKARPMLWSLHKLRSREDPLVLFTLITQAVIGAFSLLFLAPLFGFAETLQRYPLTYSGILFGLLAIQTYALFTSTMHLGKPHRFYRAFNNLRYSPVSREVAAVAVFFNGLGAYAFLHSFPAMFGFLPAFLVIGAATAFGWLALICGPVALYAMQKIYRIEARPYWNHWQVLTTFYGNALALGSLLVILAYLAVAFASGQNETAFIQFLTWPLLVGIVMEGVGLYAHQHYLKGYGLSGDSGESAAAGLEQSTTFGKTYRARNMGLALSTALVVALLFTSVEGGLQLVAWTALALILLPTAVVGRALFYVMVIPTTMPGAFFWKNKGFQEHARATGLADMPQVGVVPDAH